MNDKFYKNNNKQNDNQYSDNYYKKYDDFKGNNDNNYKKEYYKQMRQKSIDEIFSNIDFGEINELVKSGVDLAYREVKRSNVFNVAGMITSSFSDYINNRDANMHIGERIEQGFDIERYSNKPQGYIPMVIAQIGFYTIASTILISGGIFALLGISGLAALLFSIGIVSFGFGVFSSIRARTITRFRKYISYFSNREFDDIDRISKTLNIDKNKVVKDLKTMIKNNYFNQGHLVENDSLFIVNNQCYQYYYEAYKNRQKVEKEKLEIEKNDELKIFINETNEKNDELEYLSKTIVDRDVVNEIDKILNSSKQIVEVVKKYPEQLGLLNRYSTYYLPTTVKLVKTFSEMENNSERIVSSNTTKEQISSTLVTISEAFDRLLDQLLSVKKMDINADISVLNTMLSQDGLKK